MYNTVLLLTLANIHSKHKFANIDIYTYVRTYFLLQYQLTSIVIKLTCSKFNISVGFFFDRVCDELIHSIRMCFY